MTSSYQSKFPPNVSVQKGIAEYFENFYKTSDTPDAHGKYAESFTKNATMIMASKISEGYDEILATRKGMWDAVRSRHHHVEKIFPFGPDANEVMLCGTVAYELKDGRKAAVPWGARATLVNELGGWKMGFYQVYLDTAAMQNAK
ncbi:hypothetical protein LOCC1_G003999 [Lachnellula occidentalis]|uniref:SnoaL-like domain-containing protein n=1 Tax=Lachnellula occidentalis TaxID=215460 RepID=A0A8H8S081_9HELO|nr:hypothetical protein LOCC1_G003999 [Lachnellula occidentalis]